MRRFVGSGIFGLIGLGILGPVSQSYGEANQVIVRSDTARLAGLQDEFLKLARGASGAVVAISTVVAGPDAPEDLLDPSTATPERLESYLRTCTYASGTGFAIDEAGHILTNEHVIAGARYVWLTTDTGRVLPTMVVGSDPRRDLAVLLSPVALPTMPIAPAGRVERGQWSIAVGNPLGLARSGGICLSVGVISATERTLQRLSRDEGRYYSNLLQTTAEVNPGSSGGPLLNVHGEVIGVVTAVVMPQQVSNGIGFAIPLDEQTLQIVDRLRKGESVRYGYLGVHVSGIARGLRIDEVADHSPAHGVLMAGDVVRRINDQPVLTRDAFIRAIGELPGGSRCKVEITRGGTDRSYQITLRDRRLPSVPVAAGHRRMHWGGVQFVERGGRVLVNWVNNASPLKPRGAAVGLVVSNVDGAPVTSLPELLQRLRQSPTAQLAFSAPEVEQGAISSTRD